MRLNELRQYFGNGQDGWRVEYRPPIVYCKECRHRNELLAECMLAHYSVGPNDYCSKGERHDDAR